MTLADFALYTIWFLFPVTYFGMALWGCLEKLSKKKVNDDLVFYFKQGVFTLICVGVSLLIDVYYLEDLFYILVAPFISFIPLGFFRVILFAVVLIGLGKVIGPTKDIRITKAARVGGGKPLAKKRGFRFKS